MKRNRSPALLIFLPLVLLACGCGLQKSDPEVDEILQLDNDILEDPLLKELDELEASLLIQDTLQTEASEPPATTSPSTEASTSPPPIKPTTAPPPKTTEAPTTAPPATTEAVSTIPGKQVLFGVVRKTSASGVTLQVIEVRSLTEEELKRLRNGEEIPRALLTDTTLQLRYSSSVEFEKLESGRPVPADQSEIAKGQRVRVALNSAGEIRMLRVIR